MEKLSRRSLKKQQIQAETAKIKLDKAAVDAANDVKDLFTELKAFSRFKNQQKNVDVSFTYMTGRDMKPDKKEWAFALLKSNMKKYYEECPRWGWKDKVKRSEFEDDSCRVILGVDSKSGKPVCFMHIRMFLEEADRILYIWEIQIDSTYRRLGLGKWMMQMAELFAWKHEFDKIGLSVFKPNANAVSFFKKTMKYTQDAFDPTLNDPENAASYGYEILSKSRPIVRRAAAPTTTTISSSSSSSSASSTSTSSLSSSSTSSSSTTSASSTTTASKTVKAT